MSTHKIKHLAAVTLSILLVTACGSGSNKQTNETAKEEVVENRAYGILSDEYELVRAQIRQGETMGKILSNYGVTPLQIHNLEIAAKPVMPLNKIRGGNDYTLFIKQDSLGAAQLDYLAYEENLTDYVVFTLKDSTTAYRGVKPTTLRRTIKSATIENSMWLAMNQAGLPNILAAEIEDIYQWTVDFFAIDKGDNFTIIYEEKFVEDTIPAGIGRVWGARFDHRNTTYYAIPFIQNDNLQYWEADGASLRKQMLKAPLKYSRISSGFSYSRLHPVYKTYQPHTGVDYAAPSGTPVHSVADGVVIFKGWGGGGGNTLKIKHPNNITTGYLHLRGFANGIAQGSHVKQGQLIGYVGSTGTSTGPHLDYRVWKGTTPINPLKIPQEPQEPIEEQNRAAFEDIRDRIIAELDGQIEPSRIVTSLEIAPIEPDTTNLEVIK